MQLPLYTLVVEDHAGTREALVAALAAYSARVQVVAAAADGATALTAAATAGGLDCALVDLCLPDMSGVEVIAALTCRAPAVPCLALTVFDDDESIFTALAAGAGGYLLKGEPPAGIVAALEALVAGGAPLSAAPARRVVERARAAARSSAPNVAAGATGEVRFTPREREILQLLARGFTYADCARAAGIATSTVRDHVRAIYGKLKVHTKAAASAWAARHGLAG